VQQQARLLQPRRQQQHPQQPRVVHLLRHPRHRRRFHYQRLHPPEVVQLRLAAADRGHHHFHQLAAAEADHSGSHLFCRTEPSIRSGWLEAALNKHPHRQHAPRPSAHLVVPAERPAAQAGHNLVVEDLHHHHMYRQEAHPLFPAALHSGQEVFSLRRAEQFSSTRQPAAVLRKAFNRPREEPDHNYNPALERPKHCLSTAWLPPRRQP
jgi:hypothetical protein